MNPSRVAELLHKIKTEKIAELSPAEKALKDLEQQDLMRTLGKLGLLGAGIGASVRGFHGFLNTFSPRTTTNLTPARNIDLPVMYKDKDKERNKQAADDSARGGIADLALSKPGVMPAALIGTPLAVYGGWKGVDLILDKLRQRSLKKDLDKAKTDYESALLGSYKLAIDKNLNSAFTLAEKKAFSDIIPDSLKNMYATYALGSIPLSYMLVNSYMKKIGPRQVMQEAAQERARRKAEVQPPQLYAHLVNSDVEKDNLEEQD